MIKLSIAIATAIALFYSVTAQAQSMTEAQKSLENVQVGLTNLGKDLQTMSDKLCPNRGSDASVIACRADFASASMMVANVKSDLALAQFNAQIGDTAALKTSKKNFDKGFAELDQKLADLQKYAK